ncbi:MAG: MBL fold metallo-hydrolase [Deltaproteobacteria bacterium]|nr:MBL fold metallo-hydrolase [Deltaproteobacteria bacterium]
MQIKQFRYSTDNLGYLIYGETSAMAIDGGGAADEIISFIEEKGVQLKFLTNTHSHPDHTVGNETLLNRTGAIFIDTSTLLKNKKIELDGNDIQVFHTPGHSDDSVVFYFGNILVSGDTLFNGKIGRCFTGDMKGFYEAIKMLMALPEDTVIYAGHDYVEEYMGVAKSLEPDNPNIDAYVKNYDPTHVRSTLEEEFKVNPCLRFNDPKIVSILEAKGRPAGTEFERFASIRDMV